MAADRDDEERDPAPAGVADVVCPLRENCLASGAGEYQGELVFRARPDGRLEIADLAQDDSERACVMSDPEDLAEQRKER